MGKDNLLVHETPGGTTRSLMIPAEKFSKGQVYSWVLVEIFYNGKKSNGSFCAFEIGDGKENYDTAAAEAK